MNQQINNFTFDRLSRFGRMCLILCALLVGSMMVTDEARAQVAWRANETPTYTAVGDHIYNYTRNGPAMIEVYALGGGGGGQGGNTSTINIVGSTDVGTGGAGGGGAAVYARFRVNGQETLRIRVGHGGGGGQAIHSPNGTKWESGQQGYPGGNSFVYWYDWNTIVEAGAGQGGGRYRASNTQDMTGGGGGGPGVRPSDWSTFSNGIDGNDGAHKANTRSEGGSSGLIPANTGSLTTVFGNCAGGYRANNVMYGSSTGGGGCGGYNRYTNGNPGGRGEVQIRVTYIHTVTFRNAAVGQQISQRSILNGEKITQPEIPTRTGYRFDGWWTDLFDGYRWDFNTGVERNITLNAKWIPVVVMQEPIFYQWDKTVTLTGNYTYPTNLTAGRLFVYRRQTISPVSWELLNPMGMETKNDGKNNPFFYLDKNIDYDKTYEYRIVFVEDNNPSPPIGTLPDTPFIVTTENVSTKPELDFKVETKPGNNHIVVSFDADNRLISGSVMGNPTATLERRIGNTGNFSAIPTISHLVLNGNTTYTFTDNTMGSDPCNSYQYRVSINAFNKNFSNISEEVRTTDVFQFDAKQSFTASKGEYANQIQLEWRVKGQRPTGEFYRVFRRAAGTNDAWREVYADNLSGTILRWSDNSILTGVLYEYRVTSYQICNEIETPLESRTDIGFAHATGTVTGRVTYGTGTAVEGVNILARRNDLATDESQFYSLRSTGGGQAFHWLADTSYFNPMWRSQKWTLQFWLNPDEINEEIDPSEGVRWLNATHIGQIGNIPIHWIRVAGGYQIILNGVDLVSGFPTRVIRSEIIPANHFSHITIVRNGTDLSIYTVVDRNPDNIELKSATIAVDIAGNLQVQESGIYFGGNSQYNIDDVRFWNRSLNDTEIKRDYSRRLAGNESGLRGYWTFDENLPGYAFDMSRTGAVFNGNHATINTLKFSRIVPNEEYQLALKAITDQNGNYTISGIPYIGGGTLYSIIPTIETYQYKHQFNPQQHLLTIGSSSLTHNGINFANISSFPVTGRVLFANSNYPVEGVTISVNGTPASKDGEKIVTDLNGVFTVDVPIGRNYITLSKPGHVFANGGRFPVSGLHNFQSPLHYERNAELNFTDNTTIRIAGRVVGGQRETDKRLGFGLSNANIGQATVTLETVNNFSLNTTGSDLTVVADIGNKPSQTVIKPSTGRSNIKITTNAETGEFVAVLPPVPFRIVGAKNWEFEDIDTEDNNFTYSPQRRFIPFSIDPTSLKTVEYGGQTFSYHDSLIITRFNLPGITVRDLGAEAGAFGDKIFRYVDNVVPGNSRNITLYTVDGTGAADYTFNYPVFTQTVGNYTWEISAYEDYFDGQNPLPDRVPLAGLPVTVDNGLASHAIEVFFDDSDDVLTSEQQRLALDAGGKVNYRFVAGFPKLAGDNLLSATVSVVQNGITYYWDKNSPQASTTPVNMQGYLLGIRPVDGNNFVTTGPDHVEIVLHDPPGSNSYAYIEKGSSMVTEVTNTLQFDTNGELSSTNHLGKKTSTGISFVFVSFNAVDKEIINDNINGAYWAQSNMKGNKNVITTTFNEQISTSNKPNHVGTMADVYIGKTTNLVFGKTRNLSLYPMEQDAKFALDMREITAVGQEFSTAFTYTQDFIVNTLLPNIRQLRNDLIVSVSEIQQQITFDTHNNPLYFTTLSRNHPDFGSNESYVAYFAPDAPFDKRIDMVAEYNLWIANWEQIIADNEKYKIDLFNSCSNLAARNQMYNRSFDSGVNISESNTVSIEDTELSYFMDSFGSFNQNNQGTIVDDPFGLGKIFDKVPPIFSENFLMKYIIPESSLFDPLKSALSDPLNLFRANKAKNVVNHNSSSQNNIWEETTNLSNINELTFGFVLDTDGINDALTVDIYHPLNGQIMKAVMPDNSMRNLHGYTFRRQAGQTSCPHEAEERSLFFQPGQHIINNGTFRVENPELYINNAKTATIANITTGNEASFKIELHNMSEIKRTVGYQLWVDDMSNPNGLIISIDGTPLTSLRNYTIPYGTPLEKIVTVRQSSAGIFEYENIKLVMGSTCDDDIYDEVTFSVQFVPTYTITVSSGANGTITPSDNQIVNHGSRHVFTITPNNCYEIDQVLIDGTNNIVAESYTFENVTDNHTIAVSFKPKTYYSTDTKVICGSSYAWIDGKIYTSHNTTAQHTLKAVNGCDSIVTLNLAIFPHIYETNSNKWEVIDAATCVEKGSAKAFCTNESCTEYKIEELPIDENAHIFDSWEVTTPATCENTGKKTQKCSLCRELGTATQTIPALTHDMPATWTTKTTATCETVAVESKTCQRESCDHTMYNETPTPATGHSFTKWIVSPADENEELEICAICGEKSGKTREKTCDHTFTEWETTKTPTCTTKGEKNEKCSICQTLGTQKQEIAALGHDYTNAIIAPTCENKGFTTYTCSRGDEEYVDNEVAATGHSFTKWIVSHADENEELEICAICGEKSGKIRKKTCDHTFTEWETTKTPTCTTKGEKTEKCSICQTLGTQKQEIAALEHDYTSVVTPPTCTAEGYTTYTCSRGDHEYYADTVAELGHNFPTEWTVRTAATCKTKGVEYKLCTREHCTHEITQDIAALEHDYTSVVTPPTCTAEGYTTYTCSRGDHTYFADTVAELGHNFQTEWTVHTAATCKTKGVEYKLCTRENCTHEITQDIAALEHDYNAAVTPPTCTAEGYTTYTCSRGDHTYFADTVAELGHNFPTEWTVRTAATCTAAGEETRTCSACGKIENQPIAKLEHDFSDWKTTKEATCETTGAETEICSKCSAQGATRPIPATGHSAPTGVWTSGEAATCTTASTRVEMCAHKGCNHTIASENKPALAHDFGNYMFDNNATCTANGTETGACSRCSETDTRTVANSKLEHIFGNWTEKTAATCSAAGEETRICSLCAKVESRQIAKLPHTFTGWQLSQEPTCTAAGVKTEKCAICGALGAVTETIEKILYTITATAGSNGEILPDGTITVQCGTAKTFAFTPNSGYEINLVLVDNYPNSEAKENGYYTFSDINANHEIMVTFVAATTGIEETSQATSLQVYPNPTKNEIFIKSDLPIQKVELCDMAGRVVETWRAASLQGGVQNINVSHLPNGVYVIKVYTDKGVAVSKIVKE